MWHWLHVGVAKCELPSHQVRRYEVVVVVEAEVVVVAVVVVVGGQVCIGRILANPGDFSWELVKLEGGPWKL